MVKKDNTDRKSGLLDVINNECVTSVSIIMTNSFLTITMPDAESLKGKRFMAVAVTNAGVYYPMYDGNGNVVGYMSAWTGNVVAEYEYGPFGELIRSSGSMSKEFNILFSTKYYDWETSLYYYGYRYYNPSIGRWINRDPIGENGGVNLYGFVQNSPNNYYDINGLICGIKIGEAESFNISIGFGILQGTWFGPFYFTNEFDITLGHRWIEFSTNDNWGIRWNESWGFSTKPDVFCDDYPNILYSGIPIYKLKRYYDVECERPKCSTGLFSFSSSRRGYLEYGPGKDKKCEEADCREIKECMREVAQKWKGKEWNLLIRNCHDFVNDVLSSCGLRMKK